MYFSEHGHHHSKLYVLESKEVVRLSDRGTNLAARSPAAFNMIPVQSAEIGSFSE